MDGKLVSTPVCNTGVENTGRSGLYASLDWLQGTYQGTADWRVFVEQVLLLNSEEFTEIGKGMYGWSGQVIWNGIRVLHSGSASVNGVHLIMSGSACREYEVLHDMMGLLERFIRLGKLSRLDIAVDDLRGYFRMQTMTRYLRRGWYQMKYKKFRIMETWQESDVDGITVYLGSPRSAKQIRFYEKDSERRAKGYILQDGVSLWNRGEVQLRDEHAMVAAYEMLEMDIGKVYFGLLANDVRFCKGTGTNKARWKTVQWWERYLGEVQRLRISKMMPERTLVKSHIWLEEQVSKTLAMVWLACDGDFDKIVDLLELGCDKIHDFDMQKIEEQSSRLKEYLHKRDKLATGLPKESLMRRELENKLKSLYKYN